MASAIDATKPVTGAATTSAVRANFAAAEAEIDELHRATEDSVTAAGTVDALTANFTKDVVLAEGVTVVVKATGANTSTTPSLNVDATGVRTIVKDSGAALAVGDIAGARHFCIFRYDLANTVWVLMNPAVSGAVGSAVGSTVQAWDATLDSLAALNAPTSDPVGLTDTQTLTNKTHTGPTETVYSVPSSTTPNLDLANGSIQYWTLTGNSTPTLTIANGQSLTLMINDGTAYGITWTAVAQWTGGALPTLATTGYTTVTIWKVNGVVYGANVGQMSAA